MQSAAAPRALLLLESSLEEAWHLSRRIKSALNCEFYMVDSLEAAKRYLTAADNDPECAPNVVLVGRTFAQADADALFDWGKMRASLKHCAFWGSVDEPSELLPRLARHLPLSSPGEIDPPVIIEDEPLPAFVGAGNN